MRAGENKVGGTGAARPSREAEQGGLAPSGAQRKPKLVKIDDHEVPKMLQEILSRGGIVIGFTYESLPIVQIYDRQLQKYRRFTWKQVDGWYSKVIDMFEVVE